MWLCGVIGFDVMGNILAFQRDLSFSSISEGQISSAHTEAICGVKIEERIEIEMDGESDVGRKGMNSNNRKKEGNEEKLDGWRKLEGG